MMLLCIPSTISTARARDQGLVDKQASNHKVAGRPCKVNFAKEAGQQGGKRADRGQGTRNGGIVKLWRTGTNGSGPIAYSLTTRTRVV